MIYFYSLHLLGISGIYIFFILNMYLKISRKKRGGGCEQSLVYIYIDTHTRAKIYVYDASINCNIFAKRLKFNIL